MADCPDLRPFFRHYRWGPMPHSHGVPVGCDWSDPELPPGVPEEYRQNGSWTMGEVGILFNIAQQMPGMWLDIGGSTGWTAAHLAKASCEVDSVEPMYAVEAFEQRAVENLQACSAFEDVTLWPLTSEDFFEQLPSEIWYDGVVIDGCHDWPFPLEDAKSALARLKDRGVILLHDHTGAPTQEAARYLVEAGLQGSVYPTIHGVGVCWRGPLRLPPVPWHEIPR